MRKMRKIGVGEIEQLLFYLRDDLKGTRPPDAILQKGKWLHDRFGYNQPDMFQRFYEYEGEMWLVRGVPDKIDFDTATIYELKTYTNPFRKSFFMNVGQAQANLYCWLSGAKKYEVHLYLVPDERMDKYPYDYDQGKAENDLRKGLEIKKWLEEKKRTDVETYKQLVSGIAY
jgi:hypothetical protein